MADNGSTDTFAAAIESTTGERRSPVATGDLTFRRPSVTLASVEKPNTYAKGACDGRKHRLQCISCHTATLHTVQASLTDTEHVMENGVEIAAVDTDHELIQCDGCQSISYREFWSTSNEDPDHIELGPERHRLFPPRLEGRRRIMFRLPDEIEAIYTETYWALCDDSQILAGIGIRAILETVCRKKGAKTGKLVNKIEKLVDLGVLSKNDAKALHRLRDLGNEAAHKVKPLGSASLGVAMNVVEQPAKAGLLCGWRHRTQAPASEALAEAKAGGREGQSRYKATIAFWYDLSG